MPTENRSSNTELQQIEAAGAAMTQIRTMLGREQRPEQVAAALEACDWSDTPIGNKAIVLSAIRALRATQPHPEPIAWMVGTAIWWHKDGAERDSEERSEPMVPLGPCDSPSEIARVTAQFKEWQASHHRNYCKAADERDDLRGQLAQARRLLHTASIRLANWLEPGDDPRKQIIAFLEEAAEPTGTEEQPGFELIGPQLLEWNRSLVQPCILIGHEYGVATKAMKLARQALSGKS